MSAVSKTYTDAEIDEIIHVARQFNADQHSPFGRCLSIAEQLRRERDAAMCGPKDDGHREGEFSTAQLIESLREHATRSTIPTYRRTEIRAAADRLAAMHNAFLAPCPHEIERDQARELHAKVSYEYGALSAQLGEAQREIESLRAQLAIEASRREYAVAPRVERGGEAA